MERYLRSVYTDKRYRFTLRLPAWWKPFCVIDKTVYDRSAEYEVHFLFKSGGKVYGDVLNVIVYRMSRSQWKRRGYDESPLVLMGGRDGLLFAYATPGELPDAFIDPKTGDYDYAKYGRLIRRMKRMVNSDVPRIVKTFRLLKAEAAVHSGPLLSGAVKGRCRRKRKRGKCAGK